jgi:hypothetical protein
MSVTSRWGLESNPGTPEYEVGVLTTRPRRSVNRTWRCALDSSASGQEPVSVSCKHGDEPQRSIKFFDQLNVLLGPQEGLCPM